MSKPIALLAALGVPTLIAAAALLVMVLTDATALHYNTVSTSPPPAPHTISLEPNDKGYVRVETKSGSIRCSIIPELVACQTSAGNWLRRSDGRAFHVASISADGELVFADADLGELQGRVTLDAHTYSAQGWTIVAASDGMTFSNDRTGRGMTVTDQTAEPF